MRLVLKLKWKIYCKFWVEKFAQSFSYDFSLIVWWHVIGFIDWGATAQSCLYTSFARKSRGTCRGTLRCSRRSSRAFLWYAVGTTTPSYSQAKKQTQWIRYGGICLKKDDVLRKRLQHKRPPKRCRPSKWATT